MQPQHSSESDALAPARLSEFSEINCPDGTGEQVAGPSNSPARRPSARRSKKDGESDGRAKPPMAEFGVLAQLAILVFFISCDVLKNRTNEVSVRGTQVLSQTLPITVAALSLVLSLAISAAAGGKERVMVGLLL